MIRKKLMYLGVLLTLSICFVGCSKSKSVVNNDVSYEEGDDDNSYKDAKWKESGKAEIVEITDDQIKEILQTRKGEVKLSKEANAPYGVKIDLNGDGVKEVITVTGLINAKEKDAVATYMKDGALTIGNSKFEKKFPFLLEEIGLISFDGKNIAVCLYYRDEKFKLIYREVVGYDGNAINEIANLEGGNDLEFNGRGNIPFSTYLNQNKYVFINMEYEYKDGKLEMMKQQEYTYDEENIRTLLKDVTVYSDKDVKSKSSTIKKGQTISFVKTDGSSWAYIKNAQKEEGGWINLKDNVVVSDNNTKIEEMFKMSE